MDSPLAGRSSKPRRQGQTMVIDKGLGLTQTGDLLELAADYIDYVKFTFGTAALYPTEVLRAKIALIKSYGVSVYPGGTFFEVAEAQDRAFEYFQRCRNLGFDAVEVSDGTIDLPAKARRQAIESACRLGLRVVTEVGKKAAGTELDPAEAIQQIQADLLSGAGKVIIEGREGGTNVGIYDAAGRIRVDSLMQIAQDVGDPTVIMWEAPLKSQQSELIARFGPNVSLGNIPPEDVLALEALRRGLRGDTFSLALRRSDPLICQSTVGGD